MQGILKIYDANALDPLAIRKPQQIGRVIVAQDPSPVVSKMPLKRGPECVQKRIAHLIGRRFAAHGGIIPVEEKFGLELKGRQIIGRQQMRLPVREGKGGIRRKSGEMHEHIDRCFIELIETRIAAVFRVVDPVPQNPR